MSFVKKYMTLWKSNNVIRGFLSQCNFYKYCPCLLLLTAISMLSKKAGFIIYGNAVNRLNIFKPIVDNN